MFPDSRAAEVELPKPYRVQLSLFHYIADTELQNLLLALLHFVFVFVLF